MNPIPLQIMSTACHGTLPRLHLCLQYIKNSGGWYWYTNWRHWYFGPHGTDKEKGFQFVMGNTSLLILNFGCSQRISKYYQRKWTPFVSHMGTVDFQSLRGSVSHCFFLPIQSGISLKEKNHKNSSASCPCAPSAFGTETVGAHG